MSNFQYRKRNSVCKMKIALFSFIVTKILSLCAPSDFCVRLPELALSLSMARGLVLLYSTNMTITQFPPYRPQEKFLKEGPDTEWSGPKATEPQEKLSRTHQEETTENIHIIRQGKGRVVV
jgi:hypothetical protein